MSSIALLANSNLIPTFTNSLLNAVLKKPVDYCLARTYDTLVPHFKYICGSTYAKLYNIQLRLCENNQNIIFYYNLNTINAQDRDLIIKVTVNKFHGDVLDNQTYVLKSPYKSTIWSNNIKIPTSIFPNYNCALIVIFQVYNAWEKILAEERIAINSTIKYN
ncbi:hypothetical protein [Maridesulfovibrio sp.]|uniref:hypothetical protein n=1 Tax=Maridesulfovibrio sp. TaxID=2795000 RepID=UPI0029CA31DF|nr:hypothetical protein [Maridesulfovibrio sp.]